MSDIEQPQSDLIQLQQQYEKVLAKIGENHLALKELRKQNKALVKVKEDLNKQYLALKATSNGTN